jgi:hypothetical protein
LNIGNEEFADPTIYKTDEKPFPVAAEDIDNDKKIDIVVGNGYAIDIFFNAGNGTFITSQKYPINDMPAYMAINDMNADDQPDIILGNFYSIGIYYTHCD